MDEERRQFDNAAHLEIVRLIGEMQGKLTSVSDKVSNFNDQLRDNHNAIKELQWTLWGGPKESDIGLLEKHRKLARNWTIAVAVCAFIFSALGRIISPLYDKAVTDWVYNSPAEKWKMEQSRPKRTVYKVYAHPDTSEE